MYIMNICLIIQKFTRKRLQNTINQLELKKKKISPYTSEATILFYMYALRSSVFIQQTNSLIIPGETLAMIGVSRQ